MKKMQTSGAQNRKKKESQWRSRVWTKWGIRYMGKKEESGGRRNKK